MKTRNLSAFRFRQTVLILVAPLFMHIALGGFAASSGVILWSFLAPMIAVLFHGAKQSLPWFVALVVTVMAVAGARAVPRQPNRPGYPRRRLSSSS